VGMESIMDKRKDRGESGRNGESYRKEGTRE
jgi:hypothetical protein